MTDPSHIGGLPGVRFDHVAVGGRRIRDLLPLYGDALGGTFLYGGDNVRVGYRAVTLAYQDGTKIELLEPLAGSGFLDRFLARYSGGGVHHITLHTAALDTVLDSLTARGIPLTGLYRDNPEYQEVFVHPRDANGALVQIVQTSGIRAREGGLDAVLNGVDGNGVPSP